MRSILFLLASVSASADADIIHDGLGKRLFKRDIVTNQITLWDTVFETVYSTVSGACKHPETILPSITSSTPSPTIDFYAAVASNKAQESAKEAADFYAAVASNKAQESAKKAGEFYAAVESQNVEKQAQFYSAVESAKVSEASAFYAAVARAKTATTPAVYPTSPASSLDQVATEALNAHNKYRRLHGVPDLVYSNSLAEYAATYAKKCIWEHSGGISGENLAAGYASISLSIDAFYEEGKGYDYVNGNVFSEETGHFTQLIWKASTDLGCAWQSCFDNDVPGMYLVCEYGPAGNIIGTDTTGLTYFIENVLPPLTPGT